MILSRDSGDPAIGRLLLEAGANPNALGVNNITALANAAGFTDNLPMVLQP